MTDCDRDYQQINRQEILELEAQIKNFRRITDYSLIVGHKLLEPDD